MNIRGSQHGMQIAAPLVSGLLIGLSFPPYDWQALAWIALIPLAWCWKQPKLHRGTYWAAYAGGTIANCMSLSWMRTSYSDGSDWFGPNSDAWLVLGLIQATSFLAMFAYGAWLVRSVKWPLTFVLPIVWVTYEFARQLVSGAFDQMGCPWGKIGMTQADGPVISQIADLGGVYLLSFLIAMVNGACLDGLLLLQRRSSPALHALRGPIFATIVLVLVAAYGNWRLSQQAFMDGPNVCLMSKMDLPPYLNQQRLDEAAQDRPKNSNTKFDLLLWPELAFHHRIVEVPTNISLASLQNVPVDVLATAGKNLETYPEYVRTRLADCAEKHNATLVIGCERLQYDGVRWNRYNSIACANGKDRSVRLYDKCHPVPWTEFLPFAPSARNADSLVPYRRGTSPAVFETEAAGTDEKLSYSITCCYDLCFPAHFRNAFQLASQGEGIDFFVHCGAEGQDPTDALQELMLRMARLRAIETRCAFVRNVTNGVSGIIDGNGNWTVRAPEWVISKPYAVGVIPIDPRQSGYVLWGDWPMLSFVLGGLAIALIQNQRNGPSE